MMSRKSLEIHLRLAGFFPKKAKDAAEFCHLHIPILFFESGKRIKKTLEWLKATDNVNEITVEKELTKMHERVWRDLDAVLEYLNDPERQSRYGEWVLMVALSMKPQKRVWILTGPNLY